MNPTINPWIHRLRDQWIHKQSNQFPGPIMGIHIVTPIPSPISPRKCQKYESKVTDHVLSWSRRRIGSKENITPFPFFLALSRPPQIPYDATVPQFLTELPSGVFSCVLGFTRLVSVPYHTRFVFVGIFAFPGHRSLSIKTSTTQLKKWLCIYRDGDHYTNVVSCFGGLKHCRCRPRIQNCWVDRN